MIYQILKGIRAFSQGINWLKKHPKYFLLLFMPALMGVILAVMLWAPMTHFLLSLLPSFASTNHWWDPILNVILQGLFYGVATGLSLVVIVFVMNILASPIYDYVSNMVEKSVTNKTPHPISLWESFLLIKEEIKKVLLIAAINLSMLWIPGLNLLTPIVTAFLLGWDMYDFPLARRGWPLHKRVRFVSAHFFSIMGLGLWLIIPFVGVLFIPLAVVGGTLLAVKDLERKP